MSTSKAVLNKLDNTDFHIINLLVNRGDLTYKVIAEEIYLTPAAVHARVRKLEELGIIRGHYLHIDYRMLGYGIVAFLGIFLADGVEHKEVVSHLEDIPEVVEVHYTTGNYGLFIKIICKDTLDLYSLLHDKIQKIKGIQRTETLISLQENIVRPFKPNYAPV